ncbi:hypothetical protein CBR_g49485 [Chara braunii]|uniref:Reverse transcriptase domain-containing protein n=1 Tax=Chara braunii TaxID=69332 RepID=A0A388K4Y5_CHABU|nr:hypothetical protein CBR_g49485 [Chara braunii]|eukprot:GBG65122.1 hypothetical protein CBR_g49485 [Chara braunii]
MTYKAAYQPSELLCPLTYEWVPFPLCKPLLDKDKYAVLSKALKRNTAGGGGGAQASRVAPAGSSGIAAIDSPRRDTAESHPAGHVQGSVNQDRPGAGMDANGGNGLGTTGSEEVTPRHRRPQAHHPEHADQVQWPSLGGDEDGRSFHDEDSDNAANNNSAQQATTEEVALSNAVREGDDTGQGDGMEDEEEESDDDIIDELEEQVDEEGDDEITAAVGNIPVVILGRTFPYQRATSADHVSRPHQRTTSAGHVNRECHVSHPGVFMLTHSQTAVMDQKPGETVEAYQDRMLALIIEAKQRADAVAVAEKKKAEDAEQARLLALEQQRLQAEAAAKAADEERLKRREKIFSGEQALLTLAAEWRTEAETGKMEESETKIALLLSHLTDLLATCIVQQEDIHSPQLIFVCNSATTTPYWDKRLSSHAWHASPDREYKYACRVSSLSVLTSVSNASRRSDVLEELATGAAAGRCSSCCTRLRTLLTSAAWHKRFQVEPPEIKAMDKLMTLEQGSLPSVDWIAEYQRLTSVPGLPMGFKAIKHYFISRSCPTLSNALTHVEDTLTTTAQLFDKAAQIIITNKEAKNLTRAAAGPSKDQHRPKVAVVAAASPSSQFSEAEFGGRQTRRSSWRMERRSNFSTVTSRPYRCTFAPHACEPVTFDILDTDFDIILGMPWLASADHTVNFHQRTLTVRDAFDAEVPCTIPLPHPSIRCQVVTAKSFRTTCAYEQPEEIGLCFLRTSAVADSSPSDLSSNPRVVRLLDEFANIFESPTVVMSDRPISHEIILEAGAVPLKGCIYRMSEEELEVLRAQLDDLLAKGWIRPSSSPYGAPVLFVRKKNKDLRLCIDYRKLNAQTVKNAGPLPCIDDLLERLGGAKFFSKLDLKSGYHQISIRPNDCYKTAFKTRYGHFEWVVMPFGLTNAPATFQAAMTHEFHAMLDRFVLVYLDDILVYSRTLEDHLEHLRRVLETLRRAKYQANRDKCEFVRQELEYLGHFVTPEGISPLLEKIQAIQEWSEPCNVTDVRSFLGLAGYYQRFIKGYSKIAAHLTKLQCEDRPFDFDEDARESFLALKAALLSAEVLRIYDPLLPTHLTTDVSGYGIGAVLEQHDGVDWHPVEYFSKKMPAVHSIDDARKKELLAFVLLRTLIRPDRKDWVERLPDVELAYNSSIHPAIGLSPFKFEHGSPVTSPLDTIVPRTTESDDHLLFLRRMQELLVKARNQMAKTQQRMSQQANRQRLPCPFRVDNLVWVSAAEFSLEQDISRKLLPKWMGPWPIVAPPGDAPEGPSFTVQVPAHLPVYPVFHCSKLALYTPADQDDFPGRRSQDPPSMDGFQEVGDIISQRRYGNRPTEYLWLGGVAEELGFDGLDEGVGGDGEGSTNAFAATLPETLDIDAAQVLQSCGDETVEPDSVPLYWTGSVRACLDSREMLVSGSYTVQSPAIRRFTEGGD